MKHLLLVICSLLTTPITFTMQENNYSDKTITIRNVTDQQIKVEFQYYLENNHTIHHEEKDKTCIFPVSTGYFDLVVHKEKGWSRQHPEVTTFLRNPLLIIQELFPQRIELNITDNGQFQYGKTINIIKDNENITIEGKGYVTQYRRTDIPLIIGKAPHNFFYLNNLSQQDFLIHNKNLFQVIVSYTVFCTSSLKQPVPFDTDYPLRQCDLNLVEQRDTILEESTYTLHSGKAKRIASPHSYENNPITKTQTVIAIAQASPSKIFIDNELIAPSDIIEISSSPADNKITIMRIRNGYQTLLAKLYSNNFHKHHSIIE